MHRKVCKIDDQRIANYTKRLRSGSKQVFHTGNDCRDWDRYRAEGGNSKHGVEMHDKSDTIYINPPERHYYSELIDGEWWWLNGCEECNGRPRNTAKSYIECDKHNRCRRCGCGRDEVKEAPWGGLNGWICKPCAQIEHDIEKEHALASMPKNFCEYNYCDLHDIKCPYCDYLFSDSWESSDADEDDTECPRCDNVFIVTAIQALTFDCCRIDEDEEE